MISTWKSPLRLPMVPKARPMSQVASAQPASSRSISSGCAEVVRSRSLCRRPEHRVAHGTADQGQLVAGRGEALAELVEDRGDAVELGGDVPLRVGQPDAGRQTAFSGVGHGGSA